MLLGLIKSLFVPFCRLSRWNHSRIFSDFDDETEGSDVEQGDTRRSKESSLFDPKAPSVRLVVP